MVVAAHADVGAVLRRLAIPMVVAGVADQVLGIVDTIVIGSLGAAPLAAITAAGTVFTVFVIALWAFGSGLRIPAAQAVGAQALDRFGLLVRSATIAPLAMALVTIVATVLWGRALMALLLGPIPGAADAYSYLFLRMLSLIPIVIEGIVFAAFSAAGDTRLATRLMLVINVVHVPLVVVLALGWLTQRPFGLAGAGTSSLIAEIVGAVYVGILVIRRPDLRILASARIDGALAWLMARLAFPEFVFLFLMVAPEPLCVALLAPYGAPVVGAFRALSIVSDITWGVPGSLGDASEIVLGQRLGARDPDGAARFRARATQLAVYTCAACAAAVALLAWPFSALVTLDLGIATLAAGPLALHMVTLPLKGYAMSLLAPIRAAGDTNFTLTMGIVTSAIALAGIVGGTHIGFGLWAIPMAWIAAWAVRCAITAARVRRGDWLTRPLLVEEPLSVS